jgi:hypothetical protein
MPDQSSAATEHAILAEIIAPLETLPDDPLALVSADFPVALRGYDRIAVDAYVEQTAQLVAELQATRSPEAAVRRALERVGEQISGILQRAHETAEQITAQSRREAEDRLQKSRIEAAEIAAAAQRRVSDLDADTDRIWVERHRIVDDARELAQQLIALAETAAERFPSAEMGPYDDETAATRAPMVTPEEEAAAAAAGDLEAGQPVAGGFGDEPEEEPLDEGFEFGGRGAGAPAQAISPAESDETVAFTPLQADPDGEDVSGAGEDVAGEPEGPGEDLGGADAVGEGVGDAGAAGESAGGAREDVAGSDENLAVPDDDVAGPAEPSPPPPRSSSVIPPASQAANRRSSQ